MNADTGRGYKNKEYLGTCETGISEDAFWRSTDAPSSGAPDLPRFLTIIKGRNWRKDAAAQRAQGALGGNFLNISSVLPLASLPLPAPTRGCWVHVKTMPPVTRGGEVVRANPGRALELLRRLRSPPFLTAQQYEAGDGEVALCVGSPLVNTGSPFSASLPQWLVFQQSIGVSKVFAYMFDPGEVELSILEHFQRKGLVELFHYRVSRYLVDAEDLKREDKCALGGAYHQAAVEEDGGEAWVPCYQYWTFRYEMGLYFQ